MAEELQSLLNKINEEGLAKAARERDEVLDAANAKAREILRTANAEAEATRKNAENDAASLQKRAESAIQQAARDAALALRSELQERLNQVFAAAAEAMTPEQMASVLAELAKSMAANPETQMTVLTSVKDAEALQGALFAALKETFRTKPQIFADKEIRSGFSVNLSGSDIYYDFTDAAIAELLADFVGPKLAAILKG